MMASLVAAGALLAVPAVGQATDHPNKGKGKGHTTSCTKAHKMPFIVSGKFVSATADNPATPASEATVTLTVTGANHHARVSGDIADQDAVKKGVQVKGATYTVAAGDAFTLKLNGYEGTDTPSVGDRVMVKGKTPLTRKACAPAGTSTADRYGATDITKVTISDRDADA
jgi:hypothetical protein